MKNIYLFLVGLLSFSKEQASLQEEKNFFDYSSRERIKILRAAGREAQKEQQKLLETYETRFRHVAYSPKTY